MDDYYRARHNALKDAIGREMPTQQWVSSVSCDTLASELELKSMGLRSAIQELMAEVDQAAKIAAQLSDSLGTPEPCENAAQTSTSPNTPADQLRAASSMLRRANALSGRALTHINT